MNTKPTNPKERFGIRKVSMSVVPATVLSEVAVGMTEGAVKYTPYNWREAGVRASVYYDATMRHLMRWWEREDIDPDSQLSHITKAICSLMVLRDGMIQGVMTDDRPDNNLILRGFMEGLDEATAELLDKRLTESKLVGSHIRVADVTHIGPIIPTPGIPGSLFAATSATSVTCREQDVNGNCAKPNCSCWRVATGATQLIPNE